MKKLNSDDFHHMDDKNGKFVFIVNRCGLCKDLLKELRKHKTESWYFINCSEDEDYYYRHHSLDSMPTTRIYKDGVIMWERSGVLYNKQLKELNGYKI